MRTRLLRLWLQKFDERFEVQIGAVITLVLSLVLFVAFAVWTFYLVH